jgi:hypothetical protein
VRALSPKLAEALWQHRRQSNFQGDDERVFCHPTCGTVYRALTFKAPFEAGLKDAGITDYVRPFHDLFRDEADRLEARLLGEPEKESVVAA